MNWSDLLQFILSLINKAPTNNPVPSPIPDPSPSPASLKISVTRMFSNTSGQFDTVQIINNGNTVWSGVAGENNVLPNLPILPGQYHIQWWNSPHEGYEDILLQNVQGHEGIECHIGNYPNSNPKHPDYGDSKGCFLIGLSFDTASNPTMICNSTEGFNEFKNNLPEDLSNVIFEVS